MIKRKIVNIVLYVSRNILPRFVAAHIVGIPFFFKAIPVWFNYIFHKNDNFETELSIAAVLKNEAPYIKEWIEFHKLVGVEKFYLYDDGSTDNLYDILQPYIAKGEVVCYPFKKNWWQFYAYNDAIKKYRNKTKWLACIDLDEFIVPMSKEKIPDTITEIETNLKKKITGLAVHWVTYGYCGHYNKPKGLVTQNYTKSDGIQPLYKSIVNPRTVISGTGAHSFLYLFNKTALNEKGTKIYNELISTAADGFNGGGGQVLIIYESITTSQNLTKSILKNVNETEMEYSTILPANIKHQNMILYFIRIRMT